MPFWFLLSYARADRDSYRVAAMDLRCQNMVSRNRGFQSPLAWLSTQGWK